MKKVPPSKITAVEFLATQIAVFSELPYAFRCAVIVSCAALVAWACSWLAMGGASRFGGRLRSIAVHGSTNNPEQELSFACCEQTAARCCVTGRRQRELDENVDRSVAFRSAAEASGGWLATPGHLISMDN